MILKGMVSYRQVNFEAQQKNYIYRHSMHTIREIFAEEEEVVLEKSEEMPWHSRQWILMGTIPSRNQTKYHE